MSLTLELEAFVRSNRACEHLVHRLPKVEHLVSSRDEALDERTLLERVLLLPRARHEEDLLLALLPPRDDVVERGEVRRGRGLEPEELDDSRAVLRVVDCAELEGDAGLFVEGVVLFRVRLGERSEEVERLRRRA